MTSHFARTCTDPCLTVSWFNRLNSAFGGSFVTPLLSSDVQLLLENSRRDQEGTTTIGYRSLPQEIVYAIDSHYQYVHVSRNTTAGH